MTVRLSGQLNCRDTADVAIVEAHLPDHIRLTRAEPGCLSFEVRQSDDPLVWTVEEEFATRSDFDAHQTRTKASRWGQVSRDIPREYQISED